MTKTGEVTLKILFIFSRWGHAGRLESLELASVTGCFLHAAACTASFWLKHTVLV